MSETTTTETPAIDEGWEWAIVEIFGHRRHVGKAREEERFGAKMLRIDVPKIGATKDDVTWSSHFYGGSSIFSYTVTDEKTVMNYAERSYTPALPYRDHGQSLEEEAEDLFGSSEDGDQDEGDDE
jgi:hypothetical protein